MSKPLTTSPSSSQTNSLLSFPPYATTTPSRLQALYSDISRQKLSNLTSYQSNVEWWRKALELVVRSGMQQDKNRLVLSAGRVLMESVKVEGVGKPLALGAVITELRASKSLILRSEFMSAKVSIYDPGWLPSRIAAFVVGKPLWWALEQLGVTGEDGLLGSGGSRADKDMGWWGEYVMVSLVEKAADEVVMRQFEREGGAGDRLYNRESFKKVFGSVLGDERESMGEVDTEVLLRYLERDRKVVVLDNEVIKFVNNDMSSEMREVGAVDRGLLELRSAVESLHMQIDGVQHKIDDCTAKASAALRQKRKPIALSYIRSRKQLEDLLAKRLGSLATLETTLMSVEAAAGDVEIMRMYESSTTTLRAILAHPSLQKDSIDRTMDALADANADAKEVDDAIRMGGELAVGDEDGINEEELQEELQALIAQEMENEKVAAKLKGEELEIPTRIPTEALDHGMHHERIPAHLL